MTRFKRLWLNFVMTLCVLGGALLFGCMALVATLAERWERRNLRSRLKGRRGDRW